MSEEQGGQCGLRKSKRERGGEMLSGLEHLFALPCDLNSIPSTHMMAQPSATPVPWALLPSPSALEHQAHM